MFSEAQDIAAMMKQQQSLIEQLQIQNEKQQIQIEQLQVGGRGLEEPTEVNPPKRQRKESFDKVCGL